MQDLLWFLPTWPLPVGEFVFFGVLLLAGVAGGEIAHRLARLPRITGYVLAGVLLGPEVSGLLQAPLREGRALIDLAIGLVVFELGYRLDLGWLRRNPWLALTAAGESVGAFAAIYFALRYFDQAPLLAACAAAVGAATSPAVVLLVAREERAAGQLTERLLLFTAVNCAVAYVALTLLLPSLHLSQPGAGQDLRAVFLHPVYLLTGGAFLAFGACHALFILARWVGKREERQFILLLALVLLVVGLARATGITVVVALLAFGILARNLDDDHVLTPVRFGKAGELMYLLLFVLTGASLGLHWGAGAALLAVVFIAVRFLGKAVALLAFGRASGLRPGGAGLLAVGLLPLSGLAIIMVRDTEALFPAAGAELAAMLLPAVALLELLGPVATRYALRRGAESDPEPGA